MSIHHKIIPFDRPLQSAGVSGGNRRIYSESEIAEIKTNAYREGMDAARGFADHQLIDFRAEVQALQDGVLRKIPGLETEMLDQLRAQLPALAIELASRLLAGFEPDAEQIRRLCEETLSLVYPERDHLELFISPHDEKLLQSISGEWRDRYPGLKITTDASLGSGDCQVRSRFGLTDARRQAKLDALSRELQPA